jgi:lysophospholipase
MELVSLPKNPAPSGATVGSFKGYDGTELRFARWDATRSPRRGTVCLFGGRNEFIEKYFEVIADLRRRGFAVATMDWRGQGGSQRKLVNPRKGYVKGFWQYDRRRRSLGLVIRWEATFCCVMRRCRVCGSNGWSCALRCST